MINVAIIGAGIGREHLVGYQALPTRFSVRVMCDLDHARAAEATLGRDTVKIVSDMGAVLADPDIDLVDICLPPHLHLFAVTAALEAGKHVICEKPLGCSLDELDQMQVAMMRADRRVFPVFQYRYGRAMRQLQALISRGLAGRALVASLETHWNRGDDYYAVPWRGTWDGEAGGAILGHAIHAHDLLCEVMGPVAEVSAQLTTSVNDIEVDDCAAIALRLENGALATSSVTLGAADDSTRLRFCFEGLTAESGRNPYRPAEDIWTFRARGATGQEEVDAVVAAVTEPLSGFAGFLEAVADALAGRAGREVGFADGRRSIELVTALYLSARERRPVALPVDKVAALYRGWRPE